MISPLHLCVSLQISSEKRASAEMMKPKPKPQKKKKKKDPNEPQKPVSAYALFFRDTQAAIKGQNPNATFGDVSKIVASMWDSLGEEQKQVWNVIVFTYEYIYRVQCLLSVYSGVTNLNCQSDRIFLYRDSCVRTQIKWNKN